MTTASILLVTGCTGVIGDPSGGTSSERGSQTEPRSTEADCDERAPLGVSPLSRLTRAEYDNTVRDLLGTTASPADAFTVDEQLGVFSRNAGIPVTSLQLDQYRVAAEELAAAAVADLDSLLPCDPGPDPDGCVRRFIETFGRRAFRRPLGADEADALDAVGVAFAGPDGSVSDRIEGIVQAALQAPQFLYRVELGSGTASGGTIALTDYELASRLSFFLFSTAPDDELLDAAAAGELSAPGGMEAWAGRMMDDPRFDRTLESFARQWLLLDDLATMEARDPELYPEFDDALRASMYAETVTFFGHVVTEPGGTLRELLTAPYTFADQDVADVYGVAHPGSGGVVEVELDPAQRAGLLTQASLLSLGSHADQSSPIRRGVFVRDRFLCDPPPPPPPTVDNTPPEPVPGQSTREAFAAHTEDEVCAGCHKLIDPIGWGFEEYDALGRFRTEDLGVEVDASGALYQTRDADGEFEGAVELADRLAGSAQVHDCMVDLVFEFGLGRVAGCESQPFAEAFWEAGGELRSLFLAIATSDAFRVRRADAREEP
jgi:hypothetical protein